MTDATRDDDRPELETPMLHGLGQAVPQVDPPAELRARVLSTVPVRAQAASVAASRSYMPWLAAAASLALAAGLAIYAAQLRTRITMLEKAQMSVAVLTAPDVARVDLAGQTIAPQASARAFWSRSRGMVFTASNLPPLPAGRTYQLWVVTAQAPISAGLLVPDRAGNVSETFSTPQDLPQPVAMAVTIEPAGGVAAPTGDRYLVGVL